MGLTEWKTRFVFGMSWFKISGERSAILTENFCKPLRSLYTNAETVPEIRPLSFYSMSFPIHYSLIILPFDALQTRTLTPLLNKP
jgi:hypothetical protein